MSNMSYCRFENTSNDLADCLDAMKNGEAGNLSSDYEKHSLKRLLDLCVEISELVNKSGDVDAFISQLQDEADAHEEKERE